jgi:hypothetical protein
MDVNMVFTIPA